MKIKIIKAREVLDSRSNPTVACRVTLTNEVTVEAMVPSGASTGTHEALELRDGDKKRYHGKGVLKAVNNINKKIAPKLKGHRVDKQEDLDVLMLRLDGTENKSKLGANAILGVSLACAHTAAKAKKMPLYEYIRKEYGLKYQGYKMPYPMMNVLNGGEHADNNLEMQEFMVVPQDKKFAKRVQVGSEVFNELKNILAKKKLSTNVGNEGGFAPALKSNEEALKLIVKAIGKKKASLAIDPAASEFYKKVPQGLGKYKVDGKWISPFDLMRIYAQWISKYPLISIEDGLAEDDWSNWRILTSELKDRALLVGDDLFVTNIHRLRLGLDKEVGNSILIKLNQIGTLSETIDCIKLAQKNNYQVIISHRSGETEDTTIADLAVAVNAEYIKTSISRSERVCKYNRLLEIADELGK